MFCPPGCHEKPTDGNETDSLGGEIQTNCGNACGGGGGNKCCPYNRSSSPLLETVVTGATAVPEFDGIGVAAADDWRLVHADFVDVPVAGGDTSIRCVVQPPPDMLATHVCVEVGLVKSGPGGTNPNAANVPPTIVVCSVDVEPCRQPPPPTTYAIPDTIPDRSTSSSKAIAAVGGDTGNDGDGDDVLDRISQDLDYLLNRKCSDQQQPETAAVSSMDPMVGGSDRNPPRKTQQQHESVVTEQQKRTKP